MKEKSLSFIKYLSFVSLIFLCSCKKILEPQIKGQAALENVVKTESGMITVVNGMYSPLEPMYGGPMQRLTDQAGDDSWTWRKEQEPDIFIVTPTYTVTEGIWTNCYRGIVRTNVVLSNVESVTDFSNKLV